MSNALQACPVDLDDALARAGDDREFLLELVDMFLDDTPARITELRAAAASGSAVQIAGIAHSIKGAAANLSAGAVRDAASALEQRARGRALDGLTALVDALEHEVGRLAEFRRTL